MSKAEFNLQAPFQPAGDQPKAIAELTAGLDRGDRFQTLLGVTGSGKTMTVANVIRNYGKPTLVLSHNKTLAAQLYGEIKSFFPNNAVEYFISYYDYYQPEAYVPTTDTYIEKDASINEDIDRLRLRATSSLMEREDVIIIATLYADLATAVSATDTDIRSFELASADGHVTGALAVEVENLAHLQKVLKAARRVKGVTEVTRKERLASDN